MLSKCELDLKHLCNYLTQEHYLPLKLLHLKLVQSISLDKDNLSDPRAFCFVHPDKWKIFYGTNLEAVSPEVRIGILLHEIGHLYLKAFNGPQAEITVDDWCSFDIPEAKYKYMDHVYTCLLTRKQVLARNVEHVSTQFVTAVGEY